MQSLLLYLSPWNFSPTVCLVCAVSAVLYARGLKALHARGEPAGLWKPLSFFVGLALDYAALQTYVDYLSQHMFWIHRLQHLILHHVAAVLIVLASPGQVMREGVPASWRQRLRRLWKGRALLGVAWVEWLLFRIIQNSVVAPLLFVGLIYYWLVPSVHFAAMLDIDLYRAMNWGMAVDGILFWWLMLAPRRDQGSAAIGYPWRILIVFLVAFPQILIGAYIALDHDLLYKVYALCGRAWNIDPLTDQQIGGLLTWIPAAMMSVIAMLIILRRILAEEAEADAARAPLDPATPRSP